MYAQRTDQPAPGLAAGVSRLPLPPVHQTQWQKTSTSPVQYTISSAPPSLAGNSPRSEQSQSSPQRTGVPTAEALARGSKDVVKPYAPPQKRKALAILDLPPPVRSDMSPRGGIRRELTHAPSSSSSTGVGPAVANPNTGALTDTPSPAPVGKESVQTRIANMDVNKMTIF